MSCLSPDLAKGGGDGGSGLGGKEPVGHCPSSSPSLIPHFHVSGWKCWTDNVESLVTPKSQAFES